MGNYLLARRKELGLTQKYVADQIGVTEATVSRWESGEIANMRRDKVMLYAKVLQTSPDFILTGKIEQEAESESTYSFYDIYLRLCNEKGISPTTAALEMGLSKSTPTTWKKRNLTPRGNALNKIANYFGVSVDYLLGHEKCELSKSRNTFKDRLKLLRQESGLSQQALADQIGTSKSSINMYERGERELGIEILNRIADCFNVSMDFLFGRSDQKIMATEIIDKSELEDVCKVPSLSEIATGISSFGNKLKNIRKKNGWTQEQLAQFLHTSKQVISRYENSQRIPKITIAQKYANLLGIPLIDLLDPGFIGDNSSPINYKERLIGAVTMMNDEEAKRLWDYLILEILPKGTSDESDK